ncbi:abnormal cell migration protein 10 [Condylostylus longicornis]|uniref:abnormal cell migration protein 10 n=1 Tax=Condylostylus longicornis TaxID=2530218 RepID=UPI00244E11AA|nr:abnormal cell migration protein 10 [Condylostylus longicornis]
MANLEETHESELDAILGELSLLEHTNSTTELRHGRTHSRSNSTVSGATNSTISSSSESGNGSENGVALREPRTESPDNDSAFSDTVSLLSSESSASSGVVSAAHLKQQHAAGNIQQIDSAKAAKIQLALQKLEHASIRRLFVKAFSADGASKSLLVDERMSCGHVTRLLADKNHVQMEPHWALVEHLTDLQMERLFEDHELLVDNLMMWSPDSKNRVLFLQRNDKVSLFCAPEKYLPGTQMAPGSEHDEHTRSMLLDEFFNTPNGGGNSNSGQIQMDGPLYMKSDYKKAWKRYHFVLRASGLYYFPKEKTKSPRDLLCLTLFTGHNVYKGIGWKKKHKAPTDFTFALKSPAEQCTAKASRSLKMLCAEDPETVDKWVTAIRIAKYGKAIFDNHKTLVEDLTREELDKFSAARSNSIGSIISSVPSQCSSNMSVPQSASNGRLSRASSSSSSGCLSDDNNGFDSEFTTGTIKRKPSMKPNLPLTSMTRQLKEVGETTVVGNANGDISNPTSPERGGTLTRRHSRRRSEESNSSGTLKRRQPPTRGSIESMNSSNASTPTPTPSTPGTPLATQANINSSLLSPLEQMPSNMTDSMFSLPPPPPEEVDASMSASTFSLDSLPPPPPPNELIDGKELSGSQMSLVSLPPPPPEVKPVILIQQQHKQQQSPIKVPTTNNVPEPPKEINATQKLIYNSKTLPVVTIDNKKEISSPVAISKTMKPSIKAPPYKSPPAYNGNGPTPALKPLTNSVSSPSTQKSVSFADSPVLLRRKVCFEDQVQQQQIHPQQLSPRKTLSNTTNSNAPLPPPRAEATRLSTNLTSPKRLSDSTSNPPRDFLKDLQRVMRKKWQVAQKCKLEPATTPHEVLGFRDFNDELGLGPNHQSHFYRETANVSNWVQEHYGNMTSNNTPNEYALYENLGNDINMIDQYNGVAHQSIIVPIKKRPPPPPPKRSESTQLTHRA